MNLFRRRTIPNGAQIHDSVYKRDGGKYARSLKLPGDVLRED
jgi:hypothetical protein